MRTARVLVASVCAFLGTTLAGAIEPGESQAIQELTPIVAAELELHGQNADLAAVEAAARAQLGATSLAFFDDGFPEDRVPAINATQPLGYTVQLDPNPTPIEVQKRKRQGGWVCRNGNCWRVSSLMWWIILVAMILM